jgi:ribonucleoside-diphosphate reductase alpha chain
VSDDVTPFGPTGKVVYERTYSRVKPDGSRETWPETVKRVAEGNLALVYGDDMSKWSTQTHGEAERLRYYMEQFAIIPAGRHLWATGVPGRQYLFNCHVAGWGQKVSEHFQFTALRLFEGGGVGTNYSAMHVAKYGQPKHHVNVHIVSSPYHKDIEELNPYLSSLKDKGSIVDVTDSREGWAGAITYLIDEAFRDNGARDITFDVSKVRPSGSPLKSSGGTASGPAPFAKMMLDIADILNSKPFTGLSAMEIDHAIAECVVAGGNRRSARMAIMRWDDPDIFRFITAKLDTGKHWTTNISVEVDDAFFEQAKHEGTQAYEVLQDVTFAMLENGEPGFWNSSLSRTGEAGEIIATNPCGEIALEAWENCNLGHVNMDWFARTGKPDYKALREAHQLITRFLIRATYGDVNDMKQAKKLASNRRIGVGHLGVQGYWAKRGVRYSDIPNDPRAAKELDTLYSVVRTAAREYAFALRIPEPVKVTAVAPTGSVAKLPGVTEGIHPLYARWFERRVRFSMRDEEQFDTVMEAQMLGFQVEDDVYDSSGMTKVIVYPTEDILMDQVRALGHPDSVVQAADELTAREMLEMQRLYQRHWADNAVSYTVNVSEGALEQHYLAMMLLEFLPHLKGTTIMVDASRPQAPYTRITHEQYLSASAKVQEDSVDLECSTGACPVK